MYKRNEQFTSPPLSVSILQLNKTLKFKISLQSILLYVIPSPSDKVPHPHKRPRKVLLTFYLTESYNMEPNEP